MTGFLSLAYMKDHNILIFSTYYIIMEIYIDLPQGLLLLHLKPLFLAA
jgi:hypothetical protein